MIKFTALHLASAKTHSDASAVAATVLGVDVERGRARGVGEGSVERVNNVEAVGCGWDEWASEHCTALTRMGFKDCGVATVMWWFLISISSSRASCERQRKPMHPA